MRIVNSEVKIAGYKARIRELHKIVKRYKTELTYLKRHWREMAEKEGYVKTD